MMLNPQLANYFEGYQDNPSWQKYSELTGVISSGWCEHDVDIIDRTMGAFDEDYVGADGLRYGNRENLGQVTCTPAETVNNGVIVTLKNGSVWNVAGTSYLSSLTIEEGSSLVGTLTVDGRDVEAAPGVYTGAITVTI